MDKQRACRADNSDDGQLPPQGKVDGATAVNGRLPLRAQILREGEVASASMSLAFLE